MFIELSTYMQRCLFLPPLKLLLASSHSFTRSTNQRLRIFLDKPSLTGSSPSTRAILRPSPLPQGSGSLFFLAIFGPVRSASVGHCNCQYLTLSRYQIDKVSRQPECLRSIFLEETVLISLPAHCRRFCTFEASVEPLKVFCVVVGAVFWT